MATMIASLFAQIGADVSGLKKGAQEVKKDLGAMGSQTGQFTASSLLNWAKIGTAVMAAKKTFDFAREGAQLDYAQTRFERLAKGAGSMSQVLMNDLRNATRGMYSDAELMASAGDLMALGLAKSHDEAVRLATVAGALDMNMNQLVLTMTNQTTMRFDALGVAVDGFDEKVDALIETGMSAEDAFNEAFLQQAEEQIEKVGHAADTTLGAFKRLSAQGGTAWENFKIQLAKAFEPVVEGLADFLENSNNVDRAVSLLGATFVQQTRDMQGNYHAVYELNGAYISQQELLELAEGALYKSGKAAQYASGGYEDAAGSALSAADAIGRLNDVNINFANSVDGYIEKARLWALGMGDMEGKTANLVAQLMNGEITLFQFEGKMRDAQAAAILADMAIGKMGNEDAQKLLEGYGLKLGQIKELLDSIASGEYSAQLIIDLIVNGGFSFAMAKVIADDNGKGWANAQSAAADAGYENRASGGPLDPRGTLVGEEGPELILGNWVYNAEETKEMLGLRPPKHFRASGGPLLDGTAGVAAIRGRYASPYGRFTNDPLISNLFSQTNAALGGAGLGPAAASLQAVASQTAMQTAQQVATQAAQQAAQSSAASVAAQSQQSATVAIAEFTREAKKANAKLDSSIEALRKDIQRLPLKIAAEISHELAIRNV